MSKIICDICGTTYQSSADSCPICGCTNETAAELLNADASMEDVLEETSAKAGRFSAASRKKEIFDFDEVNSDEDSEEDSDDDFDEDYEEDEDEVDYEEPDYDDDDDDDEEESPRHNTFVVILLTVLIVALLAAAGFIFFRFILPNMKGAETVATTTATEAVTEAPTTEPTVPCQQMAMTNAGVAELSAEGQQFLLHIKALPENTTDSIIYTSGDESIATVTADGKITAVAEGETVIYISCGKHSIECPVIVKYVEETEPTETEAAVEETVGETIVEETAPAEETAPVEETASVSDVTLKLKKTDIRLGVYYEFQLVLDCDLNPEDVTWSSEHPHIAEVDDQGNVTARKEGTTSIIAKYGDQEAQCIVRCGWY